MYDNVFVSRMVANMVEALDGRYSRKPCAKEIRMELEKFCKSVIALPIEWDGNEVCWSLERLVECAKYLSENVPNFATYSKEDVTAINKIFDELIFIRQELMQVYDSGGNAEHKIGAKINCISEILAKNAVGARYVEDAGNKPENWRDGMIFQSYESLWAVIHRVNHEWAELCMRKFSLNVFYDFWSVFKLERTLNKEKTEEEKLMEFMAILDGTKKFVPIYALQPIGFKILDSDFDGTIISCEKSTRRDSYQLFPKNEKK